MARLFWSPAVPLILMYHRIADRGPDPWKLAVSPTLFDQHLNLLKQRRTVLPLGEFGRRHRLGELPANAVAITFDDGYACNACAAAPLLERHGLPATIFLTTGCMSKDEEFWWDALERIVSITDAQKLDLLIGGAAVPIELGKRDDPDAGCSWDAGVRPATRRQAAYLELWSRLRLARESERREAMAALHRQADMPQLARPSHRVMTAAEVHKISASGLIEIGAHSVTHPVLSSLTSAEQSLEVTGSRDACCDLVGYRPHAFAYPFGDYNNDTVATVADAGFGLACTTDAFGVGREAQRLRMPRLQVGEWTTSELMAAMSDLEAN
jgi:peptidoglycan/xylan/chitin deacetylase (PgdA/CDA1 family)